MEITEYKQKHGLDTQEKLLKHIDELKRNTVVNQEIVNFLVDDFFEGEKSRTTSTRHKSRSGESHLEFPQLKSNTWFDVVREGEVSFFRTLQEQQPESIYDNILKSYDDLITNSNREEKEVLEGFKETDGKLHYEISWEFIEEMAKRMANNKSDKYPLYNWKKSIDVQDLKDAINRHHIEVMKGNYADGDEILGHIVSYACNSMMLWEQLRVK